MRAEAPVVALALGVFAVATLSGCSCPCSGRTAMQDRAGGDAIDCGDLLVGEDRLPAVVCAEEAYRAGEPFIVRFRDAGKDSAIAVSYGSDGAGRQWQANEDWLRCTGNEQRCNPDVRVVSCAALTFGDGAILCADPGPPEENVCG